MCLQPVAVMWFQLGLNLHVHTGWLVTLSVVGKRIEEMATVLYMHVRLFIYVCIYVAHSTWRSSCAEEISWRCSMGISSGGAVVQSSLGEVIYGNQRWRSSCADEL